jgi:hypothetical protein
MPAASVKLKKVSELSDEEFWAECRRRATELNIPAWRLAEELYQHREVDSVVSAR